MEEICNCGHKREDHEEGTGNCKACDLQAGYGGNDDCSRFSLKSKAIPAPPKTMEERLAKLETEVAMLTKWMNRVTSSPRR